MTTCITVRNTRRPGGFGPIALFVIAMMLTLNPAFSDANRKMQSPATDHTAATPISASATGLREDVIRIDDDFASKFRVMVPQAFQLTPPKAGNGQLSWSYPDTLDNAYLRASFSTLADGLFETLDVVPLRIEPGTSASQRRIMSQLLITRVFANVTARYINKSLDGVNIYALEDAAAVVLNGTYWDPKAGDIEVRLYGVMPAGGQNRDGLLFVSRRYIERSPTSGNLGETVVRSVRFQ